MSKLTQSQKETLSDFKSGADRLETLVAGLSDKELDYSIAPGEWTIRQIVHHLAGDGDAWSKPFWRAITNPGSTINRNAVAGTGEWIDSLAAGNCPVQNAVALIKAHRRLIVELAQQFPDAWDQYVTIVDPQGKDATLGVRQIINMLRDHLIEHLATIEAIKFQHDI